MRTLLLILLLVPMMSFGQVNESRWINSMYAQYDSEDYLKLEIVNTKIDFDNIDYDLFSASIFYATNFQRKKYRRKKLKYSSALASAAKGHSNDMVNYDFHSHRSKVKGKIKLRDRMMIVGIKQAYIGENINDTYSGEIEPTYWSFAIEIVEEWMNSEGHRANILDKNFKYLGCGVSYYVDKDWLDYNFVKTTQNFSSYSPK